MLLMGILNAITETRVTKNVFSLSTAVQLNILHLYNYSYALFSRSNKMAVPTAEPTLFRTLQLLYIHDNVETKYLNAPTIY